MPDTGERHEINSRVTAKEAETVKESKQLVSKTVSTPPGFKTPVFKTKQKPVLSHGKDLARSNAATKRRFSRGR